MNNLAKILISVGLILMFAGIIWHFFGEKIPLGRLPGDIRINSGPAKIYVPLTSCILLSLIISLVAYLFRK